MTIACRDYKAIGYAVREAVEGKRHAPPDGYKYPHLMEWSTKPKQKRLVFFWAEPTNDPAFVKFPFAMDIEGMADFATRWLASLDYGRRPDHDGDNGRGWNVYTEGWGHVDGQWQAFVAVSPAWAMYGK